MGKRMGGCKRVAGSTEKQCRLYPVEHMHSTKKAFQDKVYMVAPVVLLHQIVALAHMNHTGGFLQHCSRFITHRIVATEHIRKA